MSSGLAESALLFSARDAAAFLGISLTTFRDHVAADVPLVRIGRRVLYDRRDLQHWIDDRKASREPPPMPLARTSARAEQILAYLRSK